MVFSRTFVFVLSSFAVLQGIHGYSEKAEEAIKNLEEFELFVQKNATNNTGANSVAVALNAAEGTAEFWTEKVTEAAIQAHQVKTFALVELFERLKSLYTIVSNIDTQNAVKINDGKNLFQLAAQPIKVAIEILSILKQVPKENFTFDKVQELVENGVAVISAVKPNMIKNIPQILIKTKAQVESLSTELDEFTGEIIRRKCYPNVQCVYKLLESLKNNLKKTGNLLAASEASIVGTSMDVDMKTNDKIREQEEDIKKVARDYADVLLKSYAITKETISEHYLSIIVKYNPSSKQVQEIINSAVEFVNEISYFNDLGKNESKNSILSAGYPVIDAWNTVYYLIRNKDGNVLGNEISEVNTLLNKIYKETSKDIPDFSKEIDEFYREIRKINVSVNVGTTKYLEKEINETFVGDLLDYYLLYANTIYEEVPQQIDEAKQKVDALTEEMQSLLPQIQEAFNKLQQALQAKIKKLHEEVLYDIANRLYIGGKITHADIYWFGILNLNNTLKYWTPKINAEEVNVDKVYKAIVDKNYGSYSIRQQLISITKDVLDALKEYEDIFGTEVVKKRSAAVVTQLVDKPTEEYLQLVDYNSKNVTEVYSEKGKYVQQVPVIDADRVAFIKKGVQTFPNTTAPYVENSHYHSVKVYRTKLSLSNVLNALESIKLQMLASEAGIIAAGPQILERIQSIATEYVKILRKYALLKKNGQKFLADLPSVLVIAYRILKEKYGIEVYDFPDFTDDIVRDDEYYASLDM